MRYRIELHRDGRRVSTLTAATRAQADDARAQIEANNPDLTVTVTDTHDC